MRSAFCEILAIALPIMLLVDLAPGSPSKQSDLSEQCVQNGSILWPTCWTIDRLFQIRKNQSDRLVG